MCSIKYGAQLKLIVLQLHEMCEGRSISIIKYMSSFESVFAIHSLMFHYTAALSNVLPLCSLEIKQNILTATVAEVWLQFWGELQWYGWYKMK